MKKITTIFAFLALFTHNVTASEKENIRLLEAYLNTLSTFEAEFTQNAGGEKSTGKFYLKRPKNFLWQYEEPEKYKLIATDTFMYFHDEKREQTTQIPNGSGLTPLLTKEKFDFSNGDITIQHIEKSEDTLEATLSLSRVSEELSGTTVSLLLDVKKEAAPKLAALKTTDPLGNNVVVTFQSIKQNKPLKNETFAFTHPFDFFDTP